jgi:Cdc6-like AAA superfamily ATPase
MNNVSWRRKFTDWQSSFRKVSHLPNKLADVPTNDDKLGYTEFAEAIAAKIVDAVSDGGTPFTIGVHGAWGSGKTSFLKLIENELAKQQVRPVWFNAWKYNEEDNLWSALLQRILDNAPLNYPWYKFPFIRLRLAIENIDFRASWIEIVSKSLLFFARLFLFVTAAGIAIGLITKVGSEYIVGLASHIFPNNSVALSLVRNKATGWVSLVLALIVADPKKVLDLFSGNLGLDISKFIKKRSYKNHIAYLDEINDEFKRIIKLVSAGKPLVVFIDDLDRCLPEKALQILEAIKLFLDVENCVFVIAVDRDIVEQAISTRYAKEMDISENKGEQTSKKLDWTTLAQNYIEKIIQLSFSLPPLPPERIKKYVGFLYPSKEEDKCQDIFAIGLPPNPRKIKRVIQSFLLLKQIAMRRINGNKVNLALLAKLVIIENQFRDLHKELINLPALLDGIERSYRKEEDKLPTCIMPIKDNLDFQAKVSLYSKMIGLQELLLQDINNTTFVGIDLSDYLFLIKAISEEISQPEGVIVQGEGAIVVGTEGNIISSGHIIGTANIYNPPNLSQSSNISPTEALRLYLTNLIASFQRLRLQGIHAGSQPLGIDLEKVYVSLETVDLRSTENKDDKNAEKRDAISVILNRYRRFVIVGDPGSGKTTLLTFLSLTYARGYLEGGEIVKRRLQFDESGTLPIFVPIRNFARYLRERSADSSIDGPSLLLDYLYQYYQSQNIGLPSDFFTSFIESGNVAFLLDGLDEVDEPTLRNRVARIIESIAERYPNCRIVVTSRILGYIGSSRLGADFGIVRLCEFGKEETRKFIKDWSLSVETVLASSDSPEILRIADQQANQLIAAIENSPRIASFAVNPLLLTVVALVFRYRGMLPKRRSELYGEAIEVLLGSWDEAKGLESDTIIAGYKMDVGDKRGLLELIALWMQENKVREIERESLFELLMPVLEKIVDDRNKARKTTEIFIRLISDRSGLLIERGVGVYSFASLAFQEYLAARALANKEDGQEITLTHLYDSWWREVIILQAGYLNTQGRTRTSHLIRTILEADLKSAPDPNYNLLLASECLNDVGLARVDPELASEIQNRVRKLSSNTQ